MVLEPPVVPVKPILSVFGILTFYGKYFSIYGIIGILLGHTILNTPLITRIIFQSLNDISSNEYMLAKQMSLDNLGIFFAIEWPIIKKNIALILFKLNVIYL